MKLVISSGHGKKIEGAVGILREHEEAVRVVNQVAIELRKRKVEVVTFEDTISTTQNENLNRIVDFHNAQGPHDLDVSIHFNANENTTKLVGTECFYYSDGALAAQVSAAISGASDLPDRGEKQNKDLFFLAHTQEKAILVEVCFVDSSADAATYNANFNQVCAAIADALGGNEIEVAPDVQTGTCSWFGGPEDSGVSPSEGLAFIYEITEDNQFLFLPMQPPGTTGLARRLNPHTHYCAMRWDYSEHPKETLLQKTVLVRNPKTGFAVTCTPADWGPHEEKTGRLIDLSPSMMSDLDLETDDEVEVIFPHGDDAEA